MNKEERFQYVGNRLLQDTVVFSSPQFLRLVQRIGKEITVKHDAQIRFYSDISDDKCGYFEGRYIYINTSNLITQSFPTLDLRSISLIGVEGHECGHQNYSSIYLRRKYIKGIEEGILYPTWPIPETKQEAENLECMKMYFQKKDTVFLGVYLETAGKLHGYLEDVFVEEQMCRRFPGSIRQGILQNRQRHMEKISSLKTQVEQEESKLKIMILLLLQYMFTHKVNTWDGEIEEYMELFRACIPIVTKAVYNPGDSARYLAANQILLKLWKFLLEDVERIKETLRESMKGNRGEKENNEEAVLKDILNRWKEGMPQYSQEPSCRELRMEYKEASDVPWNGSQPEQESVSRIQAMQSDLNEADVQDTLQIEPKEEDLLLSEFKEEFTKKIDIQKELQCICLELKQEHVQRVYEEWMRDRLRNLLENTDFTPVNQEILKKVFREKEGSTDAYQKYRNLKPKIKHVMTRMKQELIPVLKRKKNHILRFQYIGKKLDVAHLWNPQKRIFQTKIPSRNMDVAIGFLMDQSGSIDKIRWEVSVLTALCVVELAEALEIPVCVNGHCTAVQRRSGKEEEIVCLHSYLEFGEKEKGKYRILDMKTGGRNRDGAALLYMAEKISRRKEKMKILIFFCDGLPNAEGYGGDVARKDLQSIQKRLRQKNITLLVAAIGSDQEDIRRIYGNACINAGDLEKLPQQILKKLLENMI